jgi:hypothetical protein
LYPDRFLEEFGGEMGYVFAEALSGLDDPDFPPASRRVKMARLLFREVLHFPLAYLDARRYLASMNTGETATGNASFGKWEVIEAWVGRRSSWRDTMIGALPFLLFGLAYLLIGINELGGHDSLTYILRVGSPKLPFITINEPMVVYFIIVLGLLIGVLKGFPRWSFAYLGMAIYFGWYYGSGSFSGVHYDSWAWLPMFTAIILGLILTRSLNPLVMLFQGSWNDWTRLSFALYAFAAPMATIVFFDMEWGTAQLYGLLFDTLLLTVGAVAFLRSRTTWGRLLSLEAVVLILVVMGLRYPSFVEDLLALHWHAFQFITIYFGWLLMPAVIGLLRWAWMHFHRDEPSVLND